MNEKLKYITEALRERFQALYSGRLSGMALFGSQARGDAEEGSDIDIVILLNGHVNASEEIRRTSEITSDLSLENDVVISCVFVSSERFINKANPLLMNIQRESILI